MASQGKKPKIKKKLLHRMKLKLTVVFGIVLAGFIVILCQLVLIQGKKGDEYEKRIFIPAKI